MHPKLDATPRCAFRTAAPESEASNLVWSMVVAVSARLVGFFKFPIIRDLAHCCQARCKIKARQKCWEPSVKKLRRSAISQVVNLAILPVRVPPTHPPLMHCGCSLRPCYISPLIVLECSSVGEQIKTTYGSLSNVRVGIEQQSN